MLKMFRAISIAIVMVFSVSHTMAQSQTPPPPPPPPPAPYVPVSEWKTFNSEQMKISVLLPTTPKEQSPSTQMRMFFSFMRQHQFIVTCMEFPAKPKSPELAYEGAIDQLKNGPLKLSLSSNKVVQISGHAAREIAAETPEGFLQARIISVENRFCQAAVTSLNKKSETEEARAFLDSFKLLDEPNEKKSDQKTSKPN